MRKFVLFIAAFVMAATVAMAQSTEKKSDDGPSIKFEKATHDFGDINQGDVVEYTFDFQNTGNEALVLSNVMTSCGCTVPQWPHDPIAAGEKSQIKVRFNSTGKMGHQTKVIRVVSNSKDGEARVTITANVLPKKADSNQ